MVIHRQKQILKAYSLTAPVKRKAGNDGYSLSEQQLKRRRKKKGRDSSKQEVKKDPDGDAVDESDANTGGIPADPKIVTNLKTVSNDLIQRPETELDNLKCDSERGAYGLELRALLRRRIDGRWACPVPNCTQSYSRKTHMKSHIKSGQAEHQIPKEILSETLCPHCFDEARDKMIMKELEDQKRSQSSLTDHPRVVEGRKETSQASTPAIGPTFQENCEETITQEEQAKMIPKDRQLAHISRIVEQLSKSTRSDTEESSGSGNGTDTSDSAEPLCKGGDRVKQRCSMIVPRPGSQASNKDRGRSFSSVIVSEGPLAVTPDILGNHAIITRSDGETEGNSDSPATQSRCRRGANTQHQPTIGLDFYDPKSTDIMQRRQPTSKAAHSPCRETQVPPSLHSVSRANKPDLHDGVRLPRNYQPYFNPEPQDDRTNANDLSSQGWKPLSYSGYGPSDHHQYLIPAGASVFATQLFGQRCDAGTQGYPNVNIEGPIYFNRSMQPDESQPLFYPVSEQAFALDAEYYGTDCHQVPHQQMQSWVNNGWSNPVNRLEQQNDSCEQKLGCSEIHGEQVPFIMNGQFTAHLNE